MDPIREMLGSDRVVLDESLELHWEPNRIQVYFSSGRHQTIRYRESDGVYRFKSTVASGPKTRRLDGGRKMIASEILLRNRITEVVGFRLTPLGKVEGWISQRAETLQREELLYYLSILAREADRFEYLLSGGDLY